jgi:ATP-dependent DNA helicase RecG
MEKAGTGIKRVRDACVGNGNMVNFDFSNSFWITIHSNLLDKKMYDDTDKVSDVLTKNQKQILQLVKQNNTISMSEMAEEIGIPKRKILDNINKLKNRNLIERIGPAKADIGK